MRGDGKDSPRSGQLMIQVGVYLFLVCAVAVGLWWLRSDRMADWQRQAEQAQVLSLGGRARGRQPAGSYHEGEWLRVRSFAPAKTGTGTWVGVEEDSVLVVHDAGEDGGRAGWLATDELGKSAALPMKVHASFVEPYDPLVLEGGLELSNCRVRRYEKSGGVYYSVSGQLRNGTSQRVSRCEVICHLQDAAGEPLTRVKSDPITLEAGRFGGFETSQARQDGLVAAFSLCARYEKVGQMQESSQVLVNLRRSREVSHE